MPCGRGANGVRSVMPCCVTTSRYGPAGSSFLSGRVSAAMKRSSVVAAPTMRTWSPSLKNFAERIAVAGGRRHLGDSHRVGAAVVGEEHDVIERAAGDDGQHRIAFADARRLDRREPADALDPAVARQDDVGVLADDVRLRIEIEHVLGRADLRPSSVAELLGDGAQLVLDRCSTACVLERRIASISLGLLRLVLQFVEDFLDFELGDLVELRVEDRVGLDLVELERPSSASRRRRPSPRFRGSA